MWKLIGVLGVLIAMWSSPAEALRYMATPCGGALRACTLTLERREPTPEDIAGLTEELVRTFLTSSGVTVGPEPLMLALIDSSEHGIVIGSIMGPGGIWTPLVFAGGNVLCCTRDFPFQLIDINGAGFVVGDDVDGPFLASAVDTTSRLPVQIVGPPDEFAETFFGSPTSFLTVDDELSILVSSPAGFFELRLADDPSAVLEPSTGLLLAGAAMTCFLARRRIGPAMNLALR
ncbi:MAG: PEP-CTERM sorting domain-containing protein [Alphaproteobacteria bacterium]|nr:PEP-CTERM sorting domain-containing protein [Alphaproteobacteria bacterium]